MVNALDTLVTDFYVNQKLALKLDLPESRETLLDLFSRLKKEFPGLANFRRFEDEFALESDELQKAYSWFSLKGTTLRSGAVNPDDLGEAYRLHRTVLDIAPWFLSISPIDIEHLELVFGFDLEAQGDRDSIVFNALLSDGPLGDMVAEEEQVIECQPVIGIALDPSSQMQAFVEVKTRTSLRERNSGIFGREPISVFLTVRNTGGIEDLKDLGTRFAALAGCAERLAEERVVPNILTPIRHTILAQS
ncbi:MAG: hypothetical protein CBC35_11130 [Planctomycetes bacterium TMED75]|nr:hypothetical protein [Planctomycetaceae bacterium]OUU90801.1 MAG: hypothetical protein CBC35_11130 [Planctomycetes bacterium TMED75]